MIVPGGCDGSSTSMIASCIFGSRRWPSAAIGLTPKRSRIRIKTRNVARAPSTSAASSVVAADGSSAAAIVRCRLSTTTNSSRAKSAMAYLRTSSAIRSARRRVFSASASARKRRSRNAAFSAISVPGSTASVATASSSMLCGMAIHSRSGCLRKLAGVDDKLAVRNRAPACFAVHDGAGQQHLRQRILQLPLDDALERARAVDRVVAGIGEPGFRLFVDFEHDLAIIEELLQMLELDVDDPLHLIAPEAVEQDDLVEPVQEFRPERAANDLHDLIPRRF